MFVYDQNIIEINDHLRLRPLTNEDYDLALEWYSDDNILWYSENTDKPYDRDMIHKMYTFLSTHGELYVIEIFEDKWMPIGDVTLSTECMPMVIIPSYQGRGIGQKVISRLIERAKELSIEKIKLSGIYLYNEKSAHAYSKCGFKETHRDDEKLYMEINL